MPIYPWWGSLLIALIFIGGGILLGVQYGWALSWVSLLAILMIIAGVMVFLHRPA